MTTLKLTAAIAVLTLSLTQGTAFAARHHATSPQYSGQLAPNNDGKWVWVPDANGNRSMRAPKHKASHPPKVRLASLGQPTSLPMGKPEPAAGDIKITHGNMVTVQTVYGFNITVHPAYAGKFLKLFTLLKERGYKVPANITQCWARGHHVAGSNHYIGAACDIQTGWNRGPAFVYHIKDVIKQAGLYDGCAFGDCGHIEAVRGTHNRAPNLYAAVDKFKVEQSTANYRP